MIYNIKKIVVFALLSIFFASCEEWLDVNPKTEIKAKNNFKDEQGYKDALTGVYLLMTQESLYGKDLTFGLLDVLAQYYTGIYASSHTYYHAKSYDYKEASMETKIGKIWLNMFNVVANVNELIENIDNVNPTMFTGRNFHLLKGEAYGLRAFLHFDLLRLYGQNYETGANTKAIPYITKTSTNVTPLSTVEEVLEYALKDLKVAEENLLIDPVIATNEQGDSYDTNYERDRCFKMNYYAVKMLQARINLYKRNYAEASKAAEEVINQPAFYWTPLTEINHTDTKQRNLVFSEELVFTLYISNLNDIYSSYFTGKDGLYMLNENYNALYELYQVGLDHDIRYEYQTVALDELRFSTKLKQASYIVAYLYRMPLMRISEAYYIAAECAVRQNNVPAAIGYLNTVRNARQIETPLYETLSSAEAENEIFKEYAKEFFAEGQLYYYFKRLNYQYIPIRSTTGTSVITSYAIPNYVFPLPDDEKEYGGRNNE